MGPVVLSCAQISFTHRPSGLVWGGPGHRDILKASEFLHEYLMLEIFKGYSSISTEHAGVTQGPRHDSQATDLCSVPRSILARQSTSEEIIIARSWQS